MDPQTIVVWVSGCVLSAVIIYLISVCTMREKTYDEVMAEQRKQHEALLGKTKPDKKDKKKKAKKSKSDVKISSSEETVASEDATDGLSDDGVSKMVELELEPEVIEPGKHDTPKQSRKNKKSILHNKEEKSLVRKSMTVEEQFHPSNMPKDDVEMKYERERRLSEKSDTGVAAAPPVAPTKKEKKKKNKEPKPEPVEIQVEEVMQMQTAPTLQGKAPGQKKDKKNKYSEGDGTPESSEVSRLFTSVSSTKLSEKEIQGLIDVLLSKSDKPGATEKQWTKKSQKGDPLALISKQLEDKDQQLGEEKTKILAAGIRLKDLNKDLVQEKQRVSLLEKSLQEVDGRHKEEIKALHLRMQNTHTEHQNETQRLITQIQQQQATSGQNQAAMIQRLTEENNKLKEAAAAAQAMAHSQVDVGNLQQKLKIMETEMSSNILKLNTEQNNNQVLQNKLKKMEKERNDADQRKKETDSVLNRKMSEYENMSRELKQAKDSYNQVNQELASTRNQYQNVEQSRNQETEVIRDVKDKLNNAETANKQLEAKLSQVTKTRTEQDQQIQTLQASLQSLQSEKVSLQNTMLEMKTSATNGVAETSVKAEEVKQLSSAKDDLSKTVDSLKKELESKSTASDELSRTIESLQKDLDAQKKRNNELKDQQNQNQQAASSDAAQIEAQLQEKKALTGKLEAEMATLRKENTQLQESAKRTSSDDDKLKVAREKWEGQIENALKEAFPNIKVKDTTRHEDFISIFRKELVQVVHSKSEEGSSEAVNSPQSIESSDTAEVSRLQAQVSHYQQVLADTERILNQLQNSVESEEQTWKQRIVNLEEENARLKKPSPSQPKDAKIIVTNGNSTTTDEDDIGFAYQCVGKSLDAIVAQMEDKVRELEERLSSSESEKLSLQSRLSESSVSLHSIKAELDLLRNSPATREDLLQELEDSRKREKELKKEKAKLSGMVKLGQDEFKREQDLVKSLQQKMQSHSLANGTSPESEAASAQSKDGTSV